MAIRRRHDVFRAYLVLTRMALKRRINRLTRGRQKGVKAGTRQATAPRKPRGLGLLVVFTLAMLLNSGLIAGLFLSRLSMELTDRYLSSTLDGLSLEDHGFDEIMESLETELAEFRNRPSNPELKAKQALFVKLREAKEASEPFYQHPMQGPEEKREDAVLFLGILLLAMGLACLFYVMGSGNQDLGQVEWSLQWLFTFPVPLKALLLSKLTEHMLGNLFGWIIFPPLLFLIFLDAGFGVLAVFLALGVTLYFHLIIGSIQLVAETWMRKRFSRARLKNLQALFTVLSTLSFFTVFAATVVDRGVSAFLRYGEGPAELLEWSPLNVPIRLALGGGDAFFALLIMLVAATGIVLSALLLAQRLLRDGLMTETGAYQGTRIPGKPVRTGWFKGVVAKDLHLLIRDRNLMVQTLIVPLAIIGFQIFANPNLFHALKTDAHHAMAIAFGLGAYVLVFSAVHVLTVEGKASWLLFTFPLGLEKILLRKAILWGVFASIMPAILIVWSFVHLEAAGFLNVVNAFMVLIGLLIYSVIGAGIGTLGTNLFEQEVKRKIRPGMVYLYMFLAGLYTYALYAADLWNKVVMLVLCLLLAYAIWQKVRDLVPYILDPAESPPPRLSLSDALITLMIFFVLQGILHLIFTKNEVMPQGVSLLISFTVAGLAAMLISLVNFEARGVKNIAKTIGFQADPSAPPRAVLRSLVEGVLFGILAVGIGLAYLWGIEHVEVLRQMKEAMPHIEQIGDKEWWWFTLLAVFAAPFFEEYLFRGLVYRGLRRSMPFPAAVVLSAALFAAVHPPISMIPVFIIGILMALCFERNRLLLAPMTVHALYNAGIVWVSF